LNSIRFDLVEREARTRRGRETVFLLGLDRLYSCFVLWHRRFPNRANAIHPPRRARRQGAFRRARMQVGLWDPVVV